MEVESHWQVKGIVFWAQEGALALKVTETKVNVEYDPLEDRYVTSQGSLYELFPFRRCAL